MIEQENLPKPQIDLPLPEKEIQASFDNKASFLSSKWLKIGIVVAVLVLVMGGVYTLGRNSVLKELNPTQPTIPPPDEPIYQGSPTPTTSDSGETVFCTQDAKLCPDGSYVSRTEPNCEFAACPTQ
ncbi:MAG: hypothetical protein UR81_C0026G0007 [Candidatus Levybacteria bacterium GW2011_GWB1_35_5]|nr:MAG: hypothetical protein UR81_C0026G0007 [Candidatus Levybacteria bacterium GW2011_GWB1_35_5]